MARKQYLETLIASLTQGELKRFALYTKTYASNKTYLNLFKSIRKNQQKVSQKYDNKYAQQRRYLYRAILESLILKDNDKSPESEVLFLIKSASYLVKKQLPEQAYAVINKALQLVRKNEMFGYHIEIIEQEKQVRLYTNPKAHRSNDEIVQEEKDLILFQSELQSLKLIYNHILNYKKQYGYIDKEMWEDLKKEVVEMGMPPNASYCATQKSKYYYYFSQTLLHWLVHFHKPAYLYSSNFLQIDSGPLSKSEYLNGLLEHSSSCLCLGKIDEVVDILSMVQHKYEKGMFGQYDNITLRIFYYRSNYELMSHIYMGDQEKVIQKIAEIENGIAYWGRKIPLEMQLILASVLKLGYFAVKDYKKARTQIVFLIQNYKSGLRLDAYEDGLMSNLIYLFTKDDRIYLEEQAQKTLKYFQNNGQDNNLDIQMKIKVSRLFLAYGKYQITKKEFLTGFQKALEDKMAYFDNHFSETDYPYLIWVNSKLYDKDYLEMAREMAPKRLNLK